jgi:hypothetical protein
MIDLLKDTIQNSPVVKIIAEYTKHVPLYKFFKLSNDKCNYKMFNDANISYVSEEANDKKYDGLLNVVDCDNETNVLVSENAIDDFKIIIDKKITDKKESIIDKLNVTDKKSYNSLSDIDLLITCHACEILVLFIKFKPFLISKLKIGLSTLKNPVSDESLPIDTTDIPLSFNNFVSVTQFSELQVRLGHVCTGCINTYFSGKPSIGSKSLGI